MPKRFKYLAAWCMTMVLVCSFSTAALCKETDHTYELPVLLYHHLVERNLSAPFIGNESVNIYEDFQNQMQYLHDNGYTTVTTAQLRGFLYNHMLLPPKCVMITFDDGYLSNAHYAYPILKQYGYSAIVFLVTSNMVSTDVSFEPTKIQMLNWRTISDTMDVFEYGCHTHNLHYFENGKSLLVSSPVQTVIADTEASLKTHVTQAYAYPYGLYSQKVINVLKSKNFDLAFTTDKGYAKATTNPLILPRFSIRQDTSFAEFEAYISHSNLK